MPLDRNTLRDRVNDLAWTLDQLDVYDADATIPITQEFVGKSRTLILKSVRADAESEWAKIQGGGGSLPGWLTGVPAKAWGGVKAVVGSKELRGAVVAVVAASAIVWGKGCLPGPWPDPAPAPIPGPVDPPKPPAPIPVDGFRVLIVTETADLSKMPASQVAILTAKSIKDYLDLRCPEVNGMKEWRMWDQNVSTANVSKTWKDAFARPRENLPWIIISNGQTGYEGPLPKTVDETLTLLKQFGGV